MIGLGILDSFGICKHKELGKTGIIPSKCIPPSILIKLLNKIRYYSISPKPNSPLKGAGIIDVAGSY